MGFFDIGIIIIIMFKVIFIILAITRIYVKHKEPNNKKKIDNLEFWKKRVEFIFIILMSILLIYLFNPRVNRLNMINYETKILLYIFGFILLLTSDWSQFFQNSKIKLFRNIKDVLGNQ
jgi:uncharacterized membrane protein YiaA